MKTNRLLRVLSLIGFLLLIAPFYDSCNGQRMHRVADANAEVTIDTTAVEIDSTAIDSTEVANAETDTVTNSVGKYEESFLDKAYEFIDDDGSENVFEFASISYDTILEFNYNELKKGIKEEGYGVIFY